MRCGVESAFSLLPEHLFLSFPPSIALWASWELRFRTLREQVLHLNSGILGRKLVCLLLNLRRKDEVENVSYNSDGGTHFMQVDHGKKYVGNFEENWLGVSLCA
jgi:hypothetical protein